VVERLVENFRGRRPETDEPRPDLAEEVSR